jgi:predicted DNA-binding ArsR family transcriptional regulator
MTQIHKKFTGEQVKVLLTAYKEGHITREEIEKTLGLGKTRFFALLKQIREKPGDFSIEYQRKSQGRLGSDIEEKI